MRFSVTIGAAAAASGYALWNFVLRPLPKVAEATPSESVQRVTSYMNEVAKYWDVDAWQFEDVPSKLTRLVEYPRADDGPTFAVMRNRKDFDGVPLLRVICFFPNHTVEEVASRMLDDAARKKWDVNYRFFEPLATFKPPAVISQMRSGFKVIQRDWAGHVIASATLSKVGVQPRSFIYERLVAKRDDGAVCATYRTLTDAEQDKVTDAVKFSPLGATVAEKAPKDVAFSAALRQAFFSSENGPAKKTQEVKMLWQEVLMLPVRRRDITVEAYRANRDNDLLAEFPDPTGVTSTVFASAHEFLREGSPFTSPLARRLYTSEKALKAAEKYPDEKAALEEVGCLMVMTSCNDAQMHRMPRVIERMGAKKLTNDTYTMLLDDLNRSRPPPIKQA